MDAAEHTCIEWEPSPGKQDDDFDEVEASLNAATDEFTANATANVMRMGFDEDDKPRDVAKMILRGTVTGKPKEVVGAYNFAMSPVVGKLSESEQERILTPRLALQKAKLWNRDGVKIRIKDKRLAGARLIDKIMDAIGTWQELIDMPIDADDSDSSSADIRIGFEYGGFFSLVGTDSSVSRFRAQFNGLSLNIEPGLDSREDYLAVALHELGHALGAVHEHQSPSARIPWNKRKVYEYYEGPPNNWEEEDVDFQIFQKYSSDVVNATDFDRESIMLYPILKEHLLPGNEHLAVGWNRVLSNCDKAFMQKHYGVASGAKEYDCDGSSPDEPGDVKPVSGKTLRPGESTSATIRNAGDKHVYKIIVNETDDYVIETLKRGTARCMVLEFSKSSTFSDSREYKLNGDGLVDARIVKNDLSPGTYYVRARHRSRFGRGRYTISFRKE